MEILLFIIAFVLSCGITILREYLRTNMHKKEGISFKQALDLTNLPIITFEQDGNKLNFLLDTGSSRSLIHNGIKDLKHTPLPYKTTITGAGGTIEATISTVEITLNNKKFADDFQVSDLTDIINFIKSKDGVNVHGILGNTFFTKYRYVIDFDRYIAYPMK